MEVKSKVDVGYHSIEEHIKTEAIRINNVLVEPNVVNVQRNLFNKSTHRKSSAKLNNVSASDQAGSHSGISVLNRELRNRTNFLAVKLENKTLNVDSSQVKNKTIEHMAVIDTAMSKGLPQITFVPSVWLLNLSFDDIGGIMKETQFLNKLDPLNMDSPILQSSRNRTANFTYAMPLKFGFCDCFERHCICYSQVVNKRLHLNKTAAFQFTFLSKTHELELNISLDSRPLYHGHVTASNSPLLCLGSNPKVVDICLYFFNMTFKVNEHQTQLLGCLDLSLNLYNKTIGAFPVDCFQIPGDPNKVHRDRKFQMMPNWVP